MPNLFQLGNFNLHAGQSSDYKIDCDALTTDDIDTCAFLIAKALGNEFSEVIGVPRGGLRLADAMKQYSTDGWPPLIVDDVYTTGTSIREFRTSNYALGAVIFNRAGDAIDSWVYGLFNLGDGI